MMDSWIQGVIVGGAGGAIAGITVWAVGLLHDKHLLRIHKKRIYEWMKANTTSEMGEQYRSTRAIASWTNLAEDRVRHVCSVHERIYLSTGREQDMWSLYDHGDRSVYDERGMMTLG